MTGHQKILNAGFRIYRVNIIQKTITQCAGFGRWNRYKTFKTQAETKRAWDDLMKDPKNIGD